MNSLFSLIVISMFIEAAISYLKTFYDNGSIQWQIIVGFIIAIVFCYDTNTNFFAIIGLAEKLPIIGIVATSLVVCRGSNYLFEFYNQLTGWRKKISETEIIEPIEEKKAVNFIN